MKRCAPVAAVLLLLACAAQAQGVVGDVLMGSLVKPRVGQWTWYDLVDGVTDRRYMVRIAIVDSERVGRRTGYWLEMEVVPRIGYRTVSKMLVTGPASDPANVHKLVQRDAVGEIHEVDLTLPDGEPEEDLAEPDGDRPRRVVGSAELTYPGGTIEAEHIVIGEDGNIVEVWLHEDVRPMGVVRLVSREGEMSLRAYGAGGPAGETAVDKELPTEPPVSVNAKVIDADAPSRSEDAPEHQEGTPE